MDQFTPKQDPFLLYIIVEDVTITIIIVGFVVGTVVGFVSVCHTCLIVVELMVQILSKNQNGITQSALDQFTPNQDPFLLYIIVEGVKITIVFVVVGAVVGVVSVCHTCLIVVELMVQILSKNQNGILSRDFAL